MIQLFPLLLGDSRDTTYQNFLQRALEYIVAGLPDDQSIGGYPLEEVRAQSLRELKFDAVGDEIPESRLPDLIRINAFVLHVVDGFIRGIYMPAHLIASTPKITGKDPLRNHFTPGSPRLN